MNNRTEWWRGDKITPFFEPVETISISTLGSQITHQIVTHFNIPHGFFEFGVSDGSITGAFVDEPLTFEKMQSMIDKVGKVVPAAHVEIKGDDHIEPIANEQVSREFARIQSPELVAETNAWLKDRYGTYIPVYHFIDNWTGRPYVVTSHENVARIKDAMR